MSTLRGTVALVACLAIAVVSWSCASAGPMALSASLHSRVGPPPHDSTFYEHEGDEQYVQEGLFGKVYGRVYPHKDSNGADGLRDGKYLARIHVDKNYNKAGLKKGWNYWVLVDTGGAGRRADFVNVFFPAGTTEYNRQPLSIKDTPHSHDHVQARWRNQSSAMAWATCGPHMCCCQGTSCDARAIAAE